MKWGKQEAKVFKQSIHLTIEDQDETYDLYEGVGDQGSVNGVDTRLVYGDNAIDITTDATELKAQLNKVVQQYKTNLLSCLDTESRTVVADGLTVFTDWDDLAQCILDGVYFLGTLKLDAVLKALSKFTPSDAATSAPFETATRKDFLSASVWLHPLSYIIADRLTTCVQLFGPEPKNSQPGVYFCPSEINSTAAAFQTFIDGMIDVSDDAADQAGALLTPLDRLHIPSVDRLNVVPYYSGFALVLATTFPSLDDTSTELYEFDDTSPGNMYFPQVLGVPAYDLKWAPLYRPVQATAKPAWFTVPTPNTGKLSYRYIGRADTSSTEVPDTSRLVDWIRTCANVRGETWMTWAGASLSGVPGSPSYATNALTADQWDNQLVEAMANAFPGVHCKTPGIGCVYPDRVSLPLFDVSEPVIRTSTEDRAVPIAAVADRFGQNKLRAWAPAGYFS